MFSLESTAPVMMHLASMEHLMGVISIALGIMQKSVEEFMQTVCTSLKVTAILCNIKTSH